MAARTGKILALVRLIGLRWIILALAILVVMALMPLLPIDEYTQAVLEWTKDLGKWASLVVTVCYIVGSILFLPGLPFTLAAGFLFGVVEGTIVVSIGSVIGAAGAFLIARYLLRNKVEEKLGHRRKFKAIDDAIRRHGFRIILLTRLSPIFPYNVQNYAYGVTKVGFWSYVFASAIGMFPGTVAFVYLGSTARNIAQIFAGGIEGGWVAQSLKIGGIIFTVLLVIYTTRFAHRALKEEIPESEEF